MSIDPNPVGKSHVGILDPQVKKVIALWEKDNPKPRWYQFWKRIQGGWYLAVRYIIAAVDFFIREIEDKLDNGPDKKASVLAALGQVYDAIVPFVLPIFLRPFNTQIKIFVIDVVASLLIDFIVGKYRDGSWHKDIEAPPAPGAPTISDVKAQ